MKSCRPASIVLSIAYTVCYLAQQQIEPAVIYIYFVLSAISRGNFEIIAKVTRIKSCRTSFLLLLSAINTLITIKSKSCRPSFGLSIA